MKYYVGLDVSLETTAICVIDGQERTLEMTSASSDPHAIAEVQHRHAKKGVRIVLECAAPSRPSASSSARSAAAENVKAFVIGHAWRQATILRSTPLSQHAWLRMTLSVASSGCSTPCCTDRQERTN